MEKNFVREMELERTKEYVRPFFITLSGLPGSGKTYFSQMLSKELQIFLLSNDYIRNYFHLFTLENDLSKIERNVIKINQMRFLKLLLTRTSFVFDRDFHSEKEFLFATCVGFFFKYELIHIKINSKDEENIKRIKNRMVDYQKIDSNIIGDNVSYSSPFDEKQYYQIKQCKNAQIPSQYFDYVIDNSGTLFQFEQEINKVIEDVKQKKYK